MIKVIHDATVLKFLDQIEKVTFKYSNHVKKKAATHINNYTTAISSEALVVKALTYVSCTLGCQIHEGLQKIVL